MLQLKKKEYIVYRIQYWKYQNCLKMIQMLRQTSGQLSPDDSVKTFDFWKHHHHLRCKTLWDAPGSDLAHWNNRKTDGTSTHSSIVDIKLWKSTNTWVRTHRVLPVYLQEVLSVGTGALVDEAFKCSNQVDTAILWKKTDTVCRTEKWSTRCSVKNTEWFCWYCKDVW